MAISFHTTKDPKERALFILVDNVYDELQPVFDEFRRVTGIFIDPYGDTKLVVENLILMRQLMRTRYTP